MPQYEVVVRRTEIEEERVGIEAESEQEARRLALGPALVLYLGLVSSDWCEDVVSVRELGNRGTPER